jgi:hypothetical protein
MDRNLCYAHLRSDARDETAYQQVAAQIAGYNASQSYWNDGRAFEPDRIGFEDEAIGARDETLVSAKEQ